jgi:hypothetical protein
MNLRLLSFIGLLSLVVIRPYRPREHGANKKSPRPLPEQWPSGFDACAHSTSLSKQAYQFLRALVAFDPRAMHTLLQKRDLRIKHFMPLHSARPSRLIWLKFAGARTSFKSAIGNRPGPPGAPQTHTTPCTMHRFGSSQDSFAPRSVSFKEAK